MKNRQGCGSAAPASSVGGATGTDSITSMWQEHYKLLLNSSQNNLKKDSVLEQIRACSMDSIDMISLGEIQSAVNSLKKGKSIGADQVSSEHYIYAHKKLHVYYFSTF